MDVLCRIFVEVCYASAEAGAVALLVIAVKRLLRRRINVRIHHALWLIVLLRFLLPVFPDSSMSVFHSLHWMASALPSKAPAPPQAWTASTGTDDGFAGKQSILSEPSGDALSASWPKNADQAAAPAETAAYPLLVKLVSLVWAAGAAAMTVRWAVHMWRMRRRARTLERTTDESILAMVDEARHLFGIRRAVSVYTGSELSSPYVSGLLHPWIYVPKAMLLQMSKNELYHVLVHELAHVKRHDMLWSLAGGFALAIHWMNPIAWLSVKGMKADRELACDACVLERLGESEAIPYGMTMIQYLKQIAIVRRQSAMLPFLESSRNNQTVRRFELIQSFKKGSYRLSALAVIGIAVISAATLTNAKEPIRDESPDSVMSVADTKKEQANEVLFASSHRTYSNLEKAVQAADFRFKAPEWIPQNYELEQVSLQLKQDDSPTSQVSMLFRGNEGGLMRYRATEGPVDLDAAYRIIAESEQNQKVRESDTVQITRESVRVQDREALKVIAEWPKYTLLYYVWQDQGVQYQLKGDFDVTDAEMTAIIDSVKEPNAVMYERFVNYDLQTMRIYDTQDLFQSPRTIGFTPKFSMRLPEDFQAIGASIGKKVNFSYPRDKADKEKRALGISYKAGESRITFAQMREAGLLDAMKERGAAGFYRIDGEEIVVKTEPMQLAGADLLKTEPYKIDGALSNPEEPDLTTYFWQEGDACYKVTFHGAIAGHDAILAYLIGLKPFDMSM